MNWNVQKGPHMFLRTYEWLGKSGLQRQDSAEGQLLGQGLQFSPHLIPPLCDDLLEGYSYDASGIYAMHSNCKQVTTGWQVTSDKTSCI